MEMEQGKIYYISFGGTQIVGRYIESDICNHWFHSQLHYWAGFENFRGVKTYCVKHGIEEIRRASPAENMRCLN